jgi:hypothetical protein
LGALGVAVVAPAALQHTQAHAFDPTKAPEIQDRRLDGLAD